MRMDKDICKVMFNEVELQGVCKRLGEQITKDYEGKDLLIVGILNGAIVFVTDLMRQIDQYRFYVRFQLRQRHHLLRQYPCGQGS